MNVFRICGVLSLSILVTACASGPKLAEIQSGITTPKSGEGRIYFYRSSSMFGAAIQPSIVLNGTVVGNSKPGGFFFVDQAPGPKEVSTTTEVEKKLTFTLDPGQTRYVRTVIGLGIIAGRVYPELVDNATGEKELAEMSYIGKPLSNQLSSENPSASRGSTPPATGNAGLRDDSAVRLEKLKSLRDRGAITQEEYDRKRKEILDSI